MRREFPVPGAEWTGIAGPLRERKSGARGDDRAGEGEWEWGAGLGFTAACFFLGGFRCWSGCVRAQKHKDSEVRSMMQRRHPALPLPILGCR